MRNLRKFSFWFVVLVCLQRLENMAAFGQEMTDEMKSLFQSFISFDLSDASRIQKPINVDEKSLTPLMIGKTIDLFLTTHPWWWVENEPYDWKDPHREFTIMMNRFGKEFYPVFEQLVQSQYPINCTNSMFFAQLTNGFDSFGNHFFEYSVNKDVYRSAILTPYMVGKGVSFLDDEDCVHQHNRYECAFLPATNCTYPDKLSKVR